MRGPDEGMKAVVGEEEVEREREGGKVGLAEFSLMVLDDSCFNVLQAEAVSFGLFEGHWLVHVLPEVAVAVLDEDELEVEVAVVEGGEAVDVHLELAAVVEVDFFV